MTDELDLPSLLRAAERAAGVGGAIVADGFGSAGNAREKAPGDWVSDVDTSSESAVRDVLDRESPSLPFFGEEGGGTRGDVGWYVDFHSGEETFVVFAGRVFRYPRGDRGARAEVEAYGRDRGVPESQLDWPD